jgi:hypothetical protein
MTAHSSITKPQTAPDGDKPPSGGFLPTSNRFFDKSTPLAKLEKEKGHGNAVAFTDP